MPKQTKHYKKRALSKKHRRTARKRGGGCGCQSNTLPNPMSLFSGGNVVMLGPTQDLTQLAGKNYYPLNTQIDNPIYNATDSRQLTNNFAVKGGKRVRKSKTRGKKTRGGNILNTVLSYSMVGANDYSGINSGSNFFSQPYDRYTVENPPHA